MSESLHLKKDGTRTVIRKNGIVGNLPSKKSTIPPTSSPIMHSSSNKDIPSVDRLAQSIAAFEALDTVMPESKGHKGTVDPEYQEFLNERLPLFVYGTLRAGHPNAGLLDMFGDKRNNATMAGVALYRGNEPWPFALETEESGSPIIGQVVWPTEEDHIKAYTFLDEYEEFDPSAREESPYERVKRTITYTDDSNKSQTTEVWVYLARGPALAYAESANRIKSGDWFKD